MSYDSMADPEEDFDEMLKNLKRKQEIEEIEEDD